MTWQIAVLLDDGTVRMDEVEAADVATAIEIGREEGVVVAALALLECEL